MTRDPASVTPVYSAAFAVSLSARTGSLTRHAVDDMRTRAEELLARDDPMRAAILGFATMFEAHQHDPDAMIELGKGLGRDLDAALGLSQQPLRERRDIDG